MGALLRFWRSAAEIAPKSSTDSSQERINDADYAYANVNLPLGKLFAEKGAK